MRSIILLVSFTGPLLCFSQQKKILIDSINAIVRNIDKLGDAHSKSYTKSNTTNQKTGEEKWQHFDNSRLSRIIINYTIDSAGYSVAHSEKYYLKGGSLIYAYESEILFTSAEGIDGGTKWGGDFYFSKGKLIDHVTLGHGKSELDNWDPEKEILSRLKKRKAELALLK